MQKLIILIIAITCLCSCVSRKLADKSIDISAGVPFSLLTPASLGKQLALTQAAEISFDNNQHELLFQAEITSKKMVVVGLLASGTRLFTIEFDGEKITSEGISKVIEKIKPGYLIADIQLSLWPDKILREHLKQHSDCFKSGQCELLNSNEGNRRRFMKDGEEIISISYRGTPSYKHQLEFKHHLRGYGLKISPLAIEEF
ncbi:DUF3261 domain-containing protein [Aliikangiella coralliicola]|uniref:DUF3261 domain-containing protein n=1 Tax=Aliikangiella coralliicola TaxID=2592383 RepID=A0A545UEE9_9GAMM|nr:DUF3261 domain-containing protein [Aliikangiella coralliicola]TQV87854.1 DUF3261 domain-containing protein [Aliikangiella coralliicola]